MSSGSDDTCARAYWYVFESSQLKCLVASLTQYCIFFDTGTPTGKGLRIVVSATVMNPRVSYIAAEPSLQIALSDVSNTISLPISSCIQT